MNKAKQTLLILFAALWSSFSNGELISNKISSIQLETIPQLYDAILEQKKEDSSVTIIEKWGDEKAYMRISYRNGKMGFEWPLISALNIEEKERFRVWTEGLEYRVVETEIGGIEVLRIDEDELLPQIGPLEGSGLTTKEMRRKSLLHIVTSTLGALYGVSVPGMKIDILVEGIELDPNEL